MRKAIFLNLIPALLTLLSGCNKDVAGLKASGLNNGFNLPPDTDFQSYTAHYRDVIKNSRIDLDRSDQMKIIEANIPFELRPTVVKKPSRGILLIHGLFDAPYQMKALGLYFQKKGFLVRGILLPGHGTISGDQLGMKADDWLKATEYGVNTLKKDVENIYIGGFSTGGGLALHYALENPGEIEALFLFSPCLKVNTGFDWLAGALSYFKDWLITRPNVDYTRYESFAVNSAVQVYELTRKVNALIPEKGFSTPVFAALSQDDRTVSSTHTIDLFKNKIVSPSSRLLIFTGADPADSYEDKRISTLDVSDTAKNIISSSHTAIIIPPEDSHYGEDGDYRNCLHYFLNSDKFEKCQTDDNILYGEITSSNLSHGILRRLSWNPQFQEMLKRISTFLENLEDKETFAVK